MLGVAARNGELTGRLAGMLEAEEVRVGLGSGVEGFNPVEAWSEDGPRTSTGTGVMGNWVRSGRWLKRQFGRLQCCFSGHGSVWNRPRDENMADRKQIVMK